MAFLPPWKSGCEFPGYSFLVAARKCHFIRTELVTTLERKATEIIAALKQDHEPVLITQHGKPAAYLIDVESFESLRDRISLLGF